MTDAIDLSSVLAAESETDKVRAWAAMEGAALAKVAVANAMAILAVNATNARIQVICADVPLMEQKVDTAAAEIKALHNFLSVLQALRDGKHRHRTKITVKTPN